MSRLVKTIVFVGYIIACNNVLALEPTIDLELEVEQSDNALQQTQDEISERQDRLNIRLGLQENLNAWGLQADYLFSHATFSENSQDDRSLLDGDATLRLGSALGFAQLFVDHSRRLSLVDPSDEILIENLQAQTTLTIRPQLNFRLTSVDTLNVSASVSNVDFSEENMRDSERTGGTLLYTHRLSAVDSVFARYTSLDITFDDADDTKINYSVAELGYRAGLRRLTYEIRAGYNESQQGDNSSGDATYFGSVDYNGASYDLGIEFSRVLTDNSFGQSGTNLDSVNNISVNGQFEIPDTYIDTQWRSFIRVFNLCTRCTLDFNFELSTEEYVLFPINDIEQTLAQASYDFDLTGPGEIGLSISQRDIDLVNSPVSSQSLLEYRVQYTRLFNNSLSMVLSGEVLKREDGVSSLSSTENRLGLSLTYAIR